MFDWPKDRKLELTGVKTKPTRAYLLADGKPLDVTATDAGAFVVSLPNVRPSAIAAVIVLEGAR